MRSIDGSGEACRCCRHARENLTHLAVCEKLGQVFEELRAMAGITQPKNEREKFRLALFLIPPDGKKVEEGWIYLHLLLWKHAVAHLVNIDTLGEKYNPKSIWQPAWIRFKAKCEALQERAHDHLRLAESRAYPKPDCVKKSGPMLPLATLDEDGKLQWDKETTKRIEDILKRK